MDYDAIALKIVPPGNYPTIGRLRHLIADAIAAEVNKATLQQREDRFPELATLRKEMEDRQQAADAEAEAVKKKHRAKQVELEEQEARLRQREKDLQAAESRLSALTKAFESYAAWMDGDGEVDENARRFNALREAYKTFSRAKS